ncbi:MAG TPA: TonB-dependent receptor [Casimicrobiaceae bacterium]|nr:TonB-dependent receptor [Casimicrobiaceae bacterium]
MQRLLNSIQRVLVCSVVLLFPFSAAAQITRFRDVVVTASRSPQRIEALVADVTVIDADEIARSGVQSLSELLQRHPGLEVVRNGGPAGVSGVFMRGANRGQTLLLIDGLRVASSSVGAPSLEAIPLFQIERIEILRGPASSLYGADAIGGVIQVFTRQPSSEFTGRIDAGYGTHVTRALSGAISGSLGALRLSLDAGGRRSKGFNATTPDAAFIFNPDRDGYSSEDIGANAVLAVAPGHEFFAQVLRNRLDAQFDGGPDFDDRTITKITAWQLGTRNRWTSVWNMRAHVGETTDDSLSQGAFGDSLFRTRQRLYAWQNDFTFPIGNLSIAAERREERLDENVGFAVTSRDTNAIVGVWQMQRNGHALQANLRHDRSNQFGGETTGAIAWGWRIDPAWRLTASAGTAFKAPSFNDLYFPGFSNPDLAPEKSRNVEGGVHWVGRRGEVQAAAHAIAWRNKVDDLIVFQCDASFNCLPQNIAKATFTGVTLSTEGSWRDTTLRASLDLQDPKDDATGRLLPRRAKRHGAVIVTQSLGALRLGFEMIASSHRFDDAENARRLSGYAIFNVTAELPIGRDVSLFARGDNVFDRNYVLASGFATGGALGFVGVRWQPR